MPGNEADDGFWDYRFIGDCEGVIIIIVSGKFILYGL